MIKKVTFSPLLQQPFFGTSKGDGNRKETTKKGDDGVVDEWVNTANMIMVIMMNVSL